MQEEDDDDAAKWRSEADQEQCPRVLGIIGKSPAVYQATRFTL